MTEQGPPASHSLRGPVTTPRPGRQPALLPPRPPRFLHSQRPPSGKEREGGLPGRDSPGGLGERCARGPRLTQGPRLAAPRCRPRGLACGGRLGTGPVTLSSRVTPSSSAPFSFHSPPTDGRSRTDAAPGPRAPPSGRGGTSPAGPGPRGAAHGHCPPFARPTLHRWAPPGGFPAWWSWASPACSCHSEAPRSWRPFLLPQRVSGVQPCSPPFPLGLVQAHTQN